MDAAQNMNPEPTNGDFGWALQRLRGGLHVRRPVWKNIGSVGHVDSDAYGPMLVAIRIADGEMRPWMPSIDDLFARDWEGV